MAKNGFGLCNAFKLRLNWFHDVLVFCKRILLRVLCYWYTWCPHSRRFQSVPFRTLKVLTESEFLQF